MNKPPDNTRFVALRKVKNSGVIDKNLAQEILEYRAYEGITQRDLAVRVGTHPATICIAEQAKPISMKVRALLRRFLDRAQAELARSRDTPEQVAS